MCSREAPQRGNTVQEVSKKGAIGGYLGNPWRQCSERHVTKQGRRQRHAKTDREDADGGASNIRFKQLFGKRQRQICVHNLSCMNHRIGANARWSQLRFVKTPRKKSNPSLPKSGRDLREVRRRPVSFFLRKTNHRSDPPRAQRHTTPHNTTQRSVKTQDSAQRDGRSRTRAAHLTVCSLHLSRPNSHLNWPPLETQ